MVEKQKDWMISSEASEQSDERSTTIEIDNNFYLISSDEVMNLDKYYSKVEYISSEMETEGR